MLLINKTASYFLIKVLSAANACRICLLVALCVCVGFFPPIPLMEPVWAVEWRWQLLMTSHDGALVFVIAFCHLQRVLRILVKS